MSSNYIGPDYYKGVCVIDVHYSYMSSLSPATISDMSMRSACDTPSPPTKSFDFRGFDASRLLILRGGNSHVRIIL